MFGPPMETKASRRLDVYTQGNPESDCQTNAPKSAREWRPAIQTTPGAIAEGSDLQLRVKKTHLFSDADALLAVRSPLPSGAAEPTHSSPATDRSRASAPPQVTTGPYSTIWDADSLLEQREAAVSIELRASGRLWHSQIWTSSARHAGALQFDSTRDWNLVGSVFTPAKQRSSSGCAPA